MPEHKKNPDPHEHRAEHAQDLAARLSDADYHVWMICNSLWETNNKQAADEWHQLSKDLTELCKRMQRLTR